MLPMCLCPTWVSAGRGQKRVLDPLELDLEIVGSCLWVLGIELGFSGRTASVLDPSHLSSPQICVFKGTVPRFIAHLAMIRLT